MVMGTNSSIWFQVGYINIQPKIKTKVLLSNPFTLIGGVHQECPLSMLLYISAAIRYLQFSLTRIKEVQIVGDGKKILSFPEDTTIFLLRDINFHTRTQSILK